MHKIVSDPDPDDPITHLPHTTNMPKLINKIKQTKERGKYFLKDLFSILVATVKVNGSHNTLRWALVSSYTSSSLAFQIFFDTKIFFL